MRLISVEIPEPDATRYQNLMPYEIFGPIRSTPPKVGNRRERRIVLPFSSPNGKSAFVPEERSDSSRALDSFPIAQEALRNAVKYSGAREFTVDLTPQPAQPVRHCHSSGLPITRPSCPSFPLVCTLGAARKAGYRRPVSRPAAIRNAVYFLLCRF
jgi:hypothetical protein